MQALLSLPNHWRTKRPAKGTRDRTGTEGFVRDSSIMVERNLPEMEAPAGTEANEGDFRDQKRTPMIVNSPLGSKAGTEKIEKEH